MIYLFCLLVSILDYEIIIIPNSLIIISREAVASENFSEISFYCTQYDSSKSSTQKNIQSYLSKDSDASIVENANRLTFNGNAFCFAGVFLFDVWIIKSSL